MLKKKKKGLCPARGKTDSLMAGLNCGYPSLTAFPILRDVCDVFLAIGDKWAKHAVRELNKASIISGESGAAGLGGLMALIFWARTLWSRTGSGRSGSGSSENGSEGVVNFNESSVVLIISTEGDTDSEIYRKILQENH